MRCLSYWRSDWDISKTSRASWVSGINVEYPSYLKREIWKNSLCCTSTFIRLQSCSTQRAILQKGDLMLHLSEKWKFWGSRKKTSFVKASFQSSCLSRVSFNAILSKADSTTKDFPHGFCKIALLVIPLTVASLKPILYGKRRFWEKYKEINFNSKLALYFAKNKFCIWIPMLMLLPDDIRRKKYWTLLLMIS